MEAAALPTSHADDHGHHGPPPAVESKVRQHQDDITELRKEIDANALLFNAIDSRRVLAEDVLAVDFDGPAGIVIYAAARPSN